MAKKAKPQLMWAIQSSGKPIAAWDMFATRKEARDEFRGVWDPKHNRIVRVEVRIVGRG